MTRRAPTEDEIEADYQKGLAEVIALVGPDEPGLHFLDRAYRREWFIEQWARGDVQNPG